MMNYVISFATGIAAGIVVEKVLTKMKEATVTNRDEMLRSCFGEPMCTTILTFSEVKDWITARKEQISNGSKVLVMKVNSETLKKLGKDMNINGVENYLIIVVMSEDNSTQDSVLIKYERIDQELEDILAKGNGTLVVEG